MAAELSCLRQASILTVFLPTSYRFLKERRDTGAVTSEANPLEDPVVRVEELVVRTKETTKIRIGAPDRAGILVELCGEFDVRDLDTLRKVRSIVLSAGLPTHVDLSGVTFLDLRCARELADRSWLYDHLLLRDPSWEAIASFKTCGRVARIAAYPREASPLRRLPRRVQTQERPGAERREAPALAV